jgi:uncharacterized protein YjbJ (UPF0337 family)
MINRQVLEGNWNQLKGKLQEKWGQLSDCDVAQFRGNVDELIGMIQQKTGEGREAVEGFLQQLSEHATTIYGQAAEATRQYVHQASDQVAEGLAGAKCLVRDRPGQSLAVCFGVGLVVGLAIALTWRCK